MPRQKMLAALFAFAMPVLAMSCDADPDPFTQQDFPLCTEGSMRILGSIDGTSIDATVLNGGGSLSQDDNGGEFQFHTDLTSNAPTAPDLMLTWDHGVDSDKISPANGTVRLTDGPLAGQSLCAGEGTIFRIPTDESLGIVQFELAGLRSGAGCTVTHTGQLRGCAH